MSLTRDYRVINDKATKDKEETAQWFSNPATIRAMLEACMSKVSSIKGQTCIIHHKSMYDGILEKAGSKKGKACGLYFFKNGIDMIIALKVVLDLMTEFQQDAFLACFSETVSPQIFQYATTQVKDKLLEAGFVHKVFFSPV